MKKIQLVILSIALIFCAEMKIQAQGEFWGLARASGGGAIFKINDDGSNFSVQKVLSIDPGGYNKKLLKATNGKFYFMTQAGGVYNGGVIFEYDPFTGILLNKFDFDLTASTPYGNLIQALNGKLYGVTLEGGTNGFGVLFEFDPGTNTFIKRFDFSDSQGRNPLGSLVQASNGKLYGLAAGPITPAPLNFLGVIFEFDPATNNYSKRVDFPSYSTGSFIEASNGKLYGMSWQGNSDAGTLLEYDPTTNTYLARIRFGFPGNLGLNPRGDLFQASNGKLYGMTTSGPLAGSGANEDVGVLFEFDPTNNVYNKKLDFSAAGGSNPWGSLTQSTNGNLYGMTTSGGTENKGVLFEFNPVSGVYAKKLDFGVSTSGVIPYGSLMPCSATTIITQPADRTVTAGDVSFHVVASGANLSYQWKKDLVDVGTNSSTLLLTNVSIADAGSYAVSVSGECDVVTSMPAILNVISPPTIGSFSPSSGPVGTVVTITGIGFSPVATGNIVFFGATKATVTAATTTNLTVTVPTGATYEPISVTANGFTGFSRQPFGITFTGPWILDAGPFVVKTNFATGVSPYSIAIGDLDGDGKSELVVSNISSNSITVFKNNSVAGSVNENSLSTAVNLSVANPIKVAIGDLNGDGKPDLVVTNIGQTVSVFNNINSTTGVVQFNPTRIDFNIDSDASEIAIGDLDGDGRPDLTLISGGSSIWVLRNNHSSGLINSSSFSAGVPYTTGNSPTGVAIGDLDQDGKPDLAVISAGETLSLFRNTSTPGIIDGGSFSGRQNLDYSTGGYPSCISIVDLDSDGKLDIGVTNLLENTVSILRNAISTPGPFSLSSFEGKVDFGVGLRPRRMTVGDIDGDGNQDLIIVNEGGNTVSILRNTTVLGGFTTSSLAAKIDFTTGTNPQHLALGDIDGDEKPDIITVNQGSNSISILKPRPGIVSFAPTSGPIGTIVTISGGYFDPNPTNNIVFFGATKATVNSATATQLTVTVPSGVTYQPISVLTSGLTAFSSKPFTVTFSGALDQHSFGANLKFSAGTLPASVAIGDLDGDNKPDLVVANQTGNSLSIFKNVNATGQISASSLAIPFTLSIAPETGPVNVVIGDLDSDGRPEIVVTLAATAKILVFKNITNPGLIDVASFDTPLSIPVGGNPKGLALGDINADGKIDLVVVISHSVSVLRNVGVGTLSFIGQNFGILSDPRGVAVNDLDGDGKLDIVVTNNPESHVAVFRNSTGVSGSAVSFDAQVPVGTVANPVFVSIGDLDGDGKPDLVVANQESFNVSVIKNNSIQGSIIMAPQHTFNTGVGPLAVSIGDLDGDGKPDLAVVNGISKTISVLRNTCAPSVIDDTSFAAIFNFEFVDSPVGLAIGDLNGDGKPELAVANSTGNSLSILRQLPHISTFAPTSGPIGTTVTITGSNFSTSLSNNVVFFGATQATVNSATDTQLTVTVPSGATYQPISVTTSGFTTFSPKPFVVTFPGVLDVSSFAVNINLFAGTGPYTVAIGDLDKDGRPDLVVANASSNNISIFKNLAAGGPISSGSLVSQTPISTGTSPYSIAIGDLDGDGLPEVVVANAASHTVSVFKNSTPGQLTFSVQEFGTGPTPYSVAIGDLNKDGKPDLVTTNGGFGSNSVSVLTNQSNGALSFGLRTFPTGPTPFDVAIDDFDGDGWLDLAVANLNGNNISILINNTVGNGTQISFANQFPVQVGTSPIALSTGDLNGDGKPDIVVANENNLNVSILINNCSPGSISMAQATFNAGLYPYSIAIGDLDGDNKPDVAVANDGSNTVSVLKNNISGVIDNNSFTRMDFSVGTAPVSVAIGDLNGDSKPEIITTNISGNSISILGGRPNISSFTPSSGPIGTTVTINGSNFGASPANNIVYFGAVSATVTSVNSSATQLTVTVPAGATHELISVLSYGLTGYSSQPFNITFTGPGILDAAPHVRKIDLATFAGPHDIAIKDLNGDGRPDLAVPNFDDKSLTLFRNTGSSFIVARTLITNTNPVSVALGDLSGDGKPDLVVTNQGSNNVTVFQNFDALVSGSFNVAKFDFPTSTNPRGVAIGDLDGDGMPDLVVANNGAASVWVYRNVGKPSDNLSPGSFAAGVPFATGSGPVNVAISDLDLDGKPDIVVVNSGDHTVSLLRNTSIPGLINAGSFEPKTDLPAGAFSTPTAIVIANMDGDGKPDLLVTNVGDNQISVFRNKTNGPGSFSPGSFQSRVVLNVEGSPRSAAIDDMDGDGKLDLIIANNGSNSISIFKNNTGSGDFIQSSFLSIPTLTTGQNPWGIAVGDLDADGKPEIATSNLGGNSISLIYNTRQAITFNSLTPKIFGDPNFNLTATASSGLTVSYVSGDPSVATVNGNSVTIIGAGTTVITASQPGNANFLPATDVAQTLTVNKADQVITFAALPAKLVSDPPFSLTATSTSGLTVTFASANSALATIVGNTATITGVGTSDITASQAGNLNYNPAIDVLQPLTVNEVAPTVSASSIVFSNVFSTQLRVSFTPGNGQKRLVVLRQAAAVNWAPADGQDYVANSNFSLASDQGGGNKVIMANAASQVDVTGLAASTIYFVKVYEYNGSGTQTKFLVPGSPSASATTLPLPNVYVTTPANNAVNRPITLTVTARLLAGASTYTIELNDAANFTGNSFVMSGARTQNFTGLAYGTLYYTRVMTDLSPDYGQVTTFTTVVPSIQVTAPANATVNQSITPNVTATNLAGATVWTIELNDAADFTGNSFVKFGARTQSFTGLSYNTTYYTRVFTDVYAPYGPITSFTTIAPNIFVSTPANNASNQNVTLNVTATNLATASAWTIELNTASNFSGTAFVQTGPRTQSFSGLAYNTTYYSRVKTDIYPFYGQTNSFDTAPAEFFAYTTAPANGATNVNLTVNVTSNTVIGAGNYTIEINPNPGFSPGTAIVQSGPGRTYSFSGLQVSTTYYTRVMTDLSTNWGQTHSFTTASALSLSYVTNPTNNAVNRLWHLNVTANSIAQATLYTIELNTDPNFLSAGITLSSASNVINFSGLAFSTVYYNRVKTDLDPGWGVTRQFTTDHPVNYSYMNAPADGATNVAYITNITANSVLDATTYTIEANTLPGFNGTSIVKIGARTQAFSLAYDQLYYVRVYTNLDPGGWGVTRSFTTGDPVSFAYVTSPVDGAVGVPSTVNVTSNIVPGAATYTIELNTTSLFDGTSFVLTGAGRTKNFTGLADGRTYYARVSTNLSGGVWGPTSSFTTFDPLARMATNWVAEDKQEEKTDEVVIEPFDLLVFNNPFKTKLSLIIRTFQSQDAMVSLQDLTGKVIYKSRERSNVIIDIERDMAPAIYLLKVETGNESKIVRVVKVD